jgi:putative MFS transporter
LRVIKTMGCQGPLPPVVPIPSFESQEQFSWLGLFKGIYLKRTLTVWLLWYCGTAVGFGLQTWLPTMFRTVYKLPVATALAYSAVGNIAVCITVIIVSFSIDRVGRKPILFTAFFVAAVSLIFLGAYQSLVSTEVIMYVAGVSLAFVAISQLTLWVYVPETYPTRMRSVGSGTAAIWARVAGMLTPALIGFLLPNYGIEAVFYTLGGFALLGVLTVVFLVIETSGRTLEELSP